MSRFYDKEDQDQLYWINFSHQSLDSYLHFLIQIILKITWSEFVWVDVLLILRILF